MGKRERFSMVDENDPQFCRFWDAYPKRVSKKEARKVWATLRPSVQLVDKMIAALAWQVQAFRWASDNWDYAPYPATWLNAEKWNDERRMAARTEATEETTEQYLERIGWCSHTPKCIDSDVCRALRAAARSKVSA